MKLKGKLTDKEINEIAIRYKEGQSLAKISRELSRTEDTVKKYLINLGIFRPRKISKTTDAVDDQSFISKYLKIRLSFLFIILPIIITLMVIFPLLNPLENFLIILGEILIGKI